MTIRVSFFYTGEDRNGHDAILSMKGGGGRHFWSFHTGCWGVHEVDMSGLT